MKTGQLFKSILILFIFVVSANIAKSETYGWHASFDSNDRNISFN